MPVIMSVLDRFELAERGVVITGSNPSFNVLTNDAIKDIIGKAVMIQSPRGENLSVKVVEVDISRSLVDQVNISILLDHSINSIEEIRVGSQIFTIENSEEF